MTIEHIVALAKECPSEYPALCPLPDVREFQDLSRALDVAGFPHLAKAVLHGIAWSRKIANGHSLRDEEDHASYPGWSWNGDAV